MENYILETGGGDEISKVANRAKEISKLRNITVEFDFNGIKCLVSDKTVVDWLVRDYQNAFIMEWKTVGDDCKMEYDYETQIELYTRKLNRAKKLKKESDKQKIEEDNKKSEVDNITAGIEIDIIPEKMEEYKQYVEKNSKDGYSKCCVDYAEQWAKLMQIEIAKGKKVVEVAQETQKPLDYIGITGFMYGCVVSALSHFWIHGEELRKWHNKEYGVSEDKKGVVNPAVLTIG